MFTHLLVPLDGSALAECVLPHMVALATAFDARVTLLHVLEPLGIGGEMSPMSPLVWQLGKAGKAAYLDELTGKLREVGVETENALLEGRAAERTVAFAQAEQVDLILLSSHGRSGLSQWNVSSVAQKILTATCASSLVVRAYQAKPVPLTGLRYRRLVVPLDGSQRAEYALPIVETLARQQDARVCLLHIVRNPEIPRHAPLTQEERQVVRWLAQCNRREAEDYLRQIQARLSVESEVRLLESDDVTATLHEMAGQEAEDLLVLGAHGYSGRRRWPYGSVTTSFIAYGTTPLLIVQDLSASEHKSTPAEIAARESWGHGGTVRSDRTTALG